jgi:hypothetical protein
MVWPQKMEPHLLPSRQRLATPGTDVMIFKIFSPKISAKKIGVFDSKQRQILKKCYHNIGF